MHRTVKTGRTSNVLKVTVSREVERASVIGFQHEAGLMLFSTVELGRVTVLAAPRAEGPFLPIKGGSFDAAIGEAIPITAAFAAPFVKLVADVDDVELDVSLTS